MEVNPQLVMDSLDWEFNVSEVFFLRDLEQSNKAWFRSWLEKIEKGKTIFVLWIPNESH